MIKLGKAVVKSRFLILLVGIVLLVPSAIGYLNTRVNYDILSYLPGEIDTMVGQDILLEKFGTGAFSFVVLEGMDDKQVKATAEEVEKVEHVKDVIWYGSIFDLSIPQEILPDEAYKFFNNAGTGSKLMIVLFDEGMASDGTMAALDTIQATVSKNVYISGMANVVNDLKKISLKEVPVYVVLAVGVCLLILFLSMDSFLVPVLFLLSIGMAVVYNLGTNVAKGEISFITQALAAVLQLGVTMDYSIFLWHSYEEYQEKYPDDKKRAMAHAVASTFSSVVGSSTTSVAGFIALCFMSFTLGLDLGIVMAKGVVFGVICCVTVLPSLILVFDRAIEKTRHPVLLPELGGVADWVTKHAVVFFILFFVILVPALFGYTRTKVYYDLAGTLPQSYPSRQGNTRMDEEFKMGAASMILADADLPSEKSVSMVNEIKKLDGVKLAVSLDSATGPMVPSEMIPADLKEKMVSGEYQIMLIVSEYATASDEVNAQCDEIERIMKSYDSTAMLIGEAPCTRDLIHITDTDFTRVSAISIIAVFIIIAIVFKSITLPIILVAVIEFAIFINMGIPYYMGVTIPFIASIVIGTIQLGCTVDYAILITNKYRKNRSSGMEKREAVSAALASSVNSVVVSALTFFGATAGVGFYSDIDMISSLCILMARGAIISMFVVILVLPAMLMVFDRLIIATSVGFRPEGSAGSGRLKRA